MMKIKIIIATIVISTLFCLNTFAGEWKIDDNGWWYQNDNGSYSINSWQEVNGKWYYFDEGGYMLSDTTTPDGYAVNKSGEWIQDIKPNIPDSPTKYEFDSIGNWVNKGKIPEGEYIYYSKDKIKNPIVNGSSSLESSTFNYIKIYEGDNVKPGTYIPTKDVGTLDISGEGVFLVGRDIKAGTYNLIKNKGDGKSVNISKCMVFNSIPSSKDQYAPNKNLAQDLYVQITRNNSVTVNDGQYIQIINCTADFVRP